MTASERATQLVRIAAEAAAEKLAENIIAYDVSEQLIITDAFLLCSAANDRQVRSIVDEVERRLREDADAKPIRREGEREGRWVLLDYADIIVHIQHEEDRVYYALERLWKDCPQVPLPPDINASGADFSVERLPEGRLAIRYALADRFVIKPEHFARAIEEQRERYAVQEAAEAAREKQERGRQRLIDMAAEQSDPNKRQLRGFRLWLARLFGLA